MLVNLNNKSAGHPMTHTACAREPPSAAQRTCSTSSSLSTPMARMTATMFTSSLLW